MRLLLTTLLLAMMFVIPAHAVDEISADDIVKLIQKGGYVIYIRHAATNHSTKEKGKRDLKDCNTQRNLSEQGKHQAMAIGVAFKKRNIPVNKIMSSPWCRTKDTAYLGFGRAEIVSDLGFSISKSAKESKRLSDVLNKMLSTQPQEGMNTLIFSHTSNLKEATNIWLKPEGAMVVFKPDVTTAAGYSLIGVVKPAYWLEVAGN